MSAVDHEAAVAKLLADLGDTADAVADRLRALDIKGRRGEFGCCPLARYLRAAGYPEAWAGVSAVGWTDDHYIDMPLAIDEFRQNFDRGVYLDLVEVAG